MSHFLRLKIVFLLPLLWIGLFSDKLSRAEEQSDAITSDIAHRLKNKSNLLIGQIKEQSKKNSQPLPQQLNNKLDYRVDDSFVYQAQKVVLIDPQNYEICFLLGNGMLIDFVNMKVFHSKYEPPAPLFSTKPHPNWKSEKALAIAKDYFPIFVPDKEFKFLEPSVKYINDTNNSKYYDGYWRVCWVRADNEGHAFWQDDVTIDISESDGLFSANVNLASRFKETTGKIISQEDADKLAKKGAEATLRWKPEVQWFANGELEAKPYQMHLYVVNPNHILQQEEVTGNYDLNARLAYEFCYTWRLKSNLNRSRVIVVWIDAYTGENLGGDVGS